MNNPARTRTAVSIKRTAKARARYVEYILIKERGCFADVEKNVGALQALRYRCRKI
jgi:hypothetical protein